MQVNSAASGCQGPSALRRVGRVAARESARAGRRQRCLWTVAELKLDAHLQDGCSGMADRAPIKSPGGARRDSRAGHPLPVSLGPSATHENDHYRSATNIGRLAASCPIASSTNVRLVQAGPSCGNASRWQTYFSSSSPASGRGGSAQTAIPTNTFATISASCPNSLPTRTTHRGVDGRSLRWKTSQAAGGCPRSGSSRWHNSCDATVPQATR